MAFHYQLILISSLDISLNFDFHWTSERSLLYWQLNLFSTRLRYIKCLLEWCDRTDICMWSWFQFEQDTTKIKEIKRVKKRVVEEKKQKRRWKRSQKRCFNGLMLNNANVAIKIFRPTWDISAIDLISLKVINDPNDMKIFLFRE